RERAHLEPVPLEGVAPAPEGDRVGEQGLGVAVPVPEVTAAGDLHGPQPERREAREAVVELERHADARDGAELQANSTSTLTARPPRNSSTAAGSSSRPIRCVTSCAKSIRPRSSSRIAVGTTSWPP